MTICLSRTSPQLKFQLSCNKHIWNVFVHCFFCAVLLKGVNRVVLCVSWPCLLCLFTVSDRLFIVFYRVFWSSGLREGSRTHVAVISVSSVRANSLYEVLQGCVGLWTVFYRCFVLLTFFSVFVQVPFRDRFLPFRVGVFLVLCVFLFFGWTSKKAYKNSCRICFATELQWTTLPAKRQEQDKLYP